MTIFSLVSFDPKFSINLPQFFKKKFDKSNVRILFIDDNFRDFPVIQNLKEIGWSVDAIDDCCNVDDDKIQNSHIIFVDFSGVARVLSESEQGISLIKLIKRKYGNKKRVILYSGQDRFSLGDNIDIADNKLSKNSDTERFIEMIEDEIKKLK